MQSKHLTEENPGILISSQYTHAILIDPTKIIASLVLAFAVKLTLVDSGHMLIGEAMMLIDWENEAAKFRVYPDTVFP